MTKKKVIILAISLICLVPIIVGACLYVRDNTGGATFTVSDTLPDGEGREATVILLGGQSNASGCSWDYCLKENVSEEKYAEYEKGYDNVYINYFATGSNKSDSFVKASVRQGEFGECFGPELGMAEKLNEMHPDRLFFIIKYAWGGSNLSSQWLSPSSLGKTGQIYKDFVNYVDASMEYLISKNYNVTISAMCWMQGESDSFSPKTAADYERNLKKFIEDVRKRYSPYASSNGIAFIDAYIADNPAFWVHCDIVNKAKQAVADSSPLNVVIDTVAHGLVCTEEPKEDPDVPHYDSMSQIKLGNLFAEELSKFLE